MNSTLWVANTGGIGTTSLFHLENQILTLQATIRNVIVESQGSNAENTGSEENSINVPCTTLLEGKYVTTNDSFGTDSLPTITVTSKELEILQQEYNKIILKKHKVWSRSFVIPQAFIGLSFQIHNGTKFILLIITENMVGYRFGEFVPTRKVTIHKEIKKSST